MTSQSIRADNSDMKKFMSSILKHFAALAMVLASAPVLAATDGQPGSTSTGNFNATLTVSPPVTDQVQVVGLDDVDFGTVTLGPYGSDWVTVPDPSMSFCLKRSTPGDVNITFDQLTNPPDDSQFRMSQGEEHLYFRIDLILPDGSRLSDMSRGFSRTVMRSDPACTASNDGAGIGHRIELHTPGVHSAYPPGLYSTTIQITLSPAG